ncbi:MAG: Gfo/Idh/MocA family protein [Opitutaceae bacterium]
MRKLRVVGLNFDHMHMGDLLRLCHEHPGVEIAGICDEDPARMQDAIRNFGLGPDRVFTDARRCLERTAPDFVILCPATARHAEYVELAAPYGAHLLVEKPFAATLAEADRMIAAARKARRLLAINWPLRWVPSHVTAHRLVREGRIGELQEVHYYDGNRGPLWHAADKLETTPTPAMKRGSWFYKKARGGGSLLDYLGYGTSLGTWFHDGAKPIEVTAVVDLEAARPFEIRDTLGHLHRPVDHAAAAQVRLRAQRRGRHDQLLRLRADDPAPNARTAAWRGHRRRPLGSAFPERDPVFRALHQRGPAGRGSAQPADRAHRPADRRLRRAQRAPRAHGETRHLMGKRVTIGP